MRIRLTQRNAARRRKAESQADGLFPGDIGNMERRENYHAPDEYANYDFNDWDLQGSDPLPLDQRNESNIGLMKTARNYSIAKKAAMLAQLFLGESAPIRQIKAQAKDFLKLGDLRLSAAIRRWKATEDVTPKKEAEAAEAEDAEAPAPAEDTETAAPAEKAAPISEEDISFEEDVSELEGGAAEAPAAEDDGSEPELNIEIPDEVEDITDTMFVKEDKSGEAEADPELEEMFQQGAAEPEKPVEQAVAKTASKKGLKHFSGQPRMAAASDMNEVKKLEGLWSNLRIPGC